MLVQSHEGVIDLLPALPDEWSEGKFKGICTRGAFELDLEWKAGKATNAVILSKQGGLCKINPKIPVVVTSNGRKIAFKNAGNGVIEFMTNKGAKYNIDTK